MAHFHSVDRDDADVEARRPGLPTIIGLALVATTLAVAMVATLGAVLFGG
jgi:hypothetical protein